LVTKYSKAIARTIYSRPDIAIFDDVFNGLDKQTAETVFARTFSDKGGLLATWQTTVVFATHSGIYVANRLNYGC
jgi:ATP-binding cassette subfamily C (CFTR/MRP) protein 1